MVEACNFDVSVNYDEIVLFDNDVSSTMTIEEQRQLTWHIFENTIIKQLESDAISRSFKDDLEYIKSQETYLNKKTFEILKQWSLDNDKPIEYIQPNDSTWTEENITNEVKDKLIIEAQKARTHAYTPYSNFQVGAAVLTKSGKVFHGGNTENAAYGSTICGERNAIVTTVEKINRGTSIVDNREIVAIAIVLRGGGSPCGMCRQMLYESNPSMKVIMSDINGKYIEENMKTMLPYGFGRSSLK